MNDKPYHNEPGFEESKFDKSSDTKKRVEAYNEIITHETIRIAVIGMLEDNSSDARNMPLVLKDVMKNSFKNNYQYFEDLVKSKLNLTDKPMNDPFRDYDRGKFVYKTLLEKLQNLKVKFDISGDQTQSSGASNGSTVQSYSELATKYMVNDVQPQLKTDSNDNWEAIIDEINMEDMDEELDIDYSEQSDSDDEQTESHDKKDDK